MTEDEQAAHDSMSMALGMIEATNSIADVMDAMKRALELREWSTPMAEQVGAMFGNAMFTMLLAAQAGQAPEPKP